MPNNPFSDQLGGLATIASDITNFIIWAVYIVGPLLFLIAFVRFTKADDPHDRKEAKKNMYYIIAGVIGVQLVLWFVQQYVWTKF